MKLNLHREALLKPLQMVIGVVERKQTLPILSNVLLNICDKSLSVTGTDLEVELIGHSSLNHPDTVEGKLTVPGRKLLDICRALPDEAAIELYQDNEKIIIRSGRSRFTLSTLPAENFPYVETNENELSFTVPQSELKQLLHRTYFAMAQQDVRYYLNGLLLEVGNNQLRAVATDGHRLAMNITPIQTHDMDKKFQAIIPRKGVLELLRLLEDNDLPVNLSLGSNHMHLTSTDFSFTSKLIEGKFPDYTRVIPRNGDKSVIIDRVELKQALNRAAILCNEKFKGVRVELRQGVMHITSNNPEQEAAEEEITIQYDKGDLEIGFNVNYLIDILNTANPGMIKLTFADANSSILIEEVDNAWQSAFVVMPMRL